MTGTAAVVTPAVPPVIPVEPSMAEYAAQREAEDRGEKIVVVVPASTTAAEPAAATESTSAAVTATSAAEPAATSAAIEPESELEEAHPAKKGINKRFGELTQARDKALAEATAARAEAERVASEAAVARAEVERLTALVAVTPPTPIVPTVEEDPLPTREAFEDPEVYAAAVAAYAARGEIRKANAAAEAEVAKANAEAKAAQETERQVKVQAQIAELHKNFNDRLTAAIPEYPDFKEKVTENTDLVLRNDTFFMIEQSELAPHILYHLAAHPDEVKSLEELPPYQAAMRLGEIQVQIREARKPQVSKAAEPVKPIGNRASPGRKTPNEETMEEYAARREQEEVAARKKKRTH